MTKKTKIREILEKYADLMTSPMRTKIIWECDFDKLEEELIKLFKKSCK